MQPGSPLHLGLAWEFLNNASVDLDAAAVMFDAYGQVIDAVFYNQMQALGGAVTHSGDCRNGEIVGDDEVITIHPHMLPPSVVAVALVVNCYNVGSFAEVSTAVARVCTGPNREYEMLRYAPSCAGAHTGFVIGMLTLQLQGPNAGWNFKAIGSPASGRNFEASMAEIQGALSHAIDKHDLVHYTPGQRFNMQKGDTFEIPCDVVTMGLGWDPCRGPDMDLDAAVITLDRVGNVCDTIYFKNLMAPGIQHTGDNLTGEGDGDDEQIILKLNQIQGNVATMLFVVNIYNLNRVFRDVDNEFCRLVDSSTGAELCHFELDYMDKQVDASNNLIMCKLFRGSSGRWQMQSLGMGLMGSRTAVELAGILQGMPMVRQYALNLPCYSPIPVDLNAPRKPKKKKKSGGDGCQCTMM